MNTAIIWWGLLFSSVGLGYFIYGRRQSDMVIRYSGIALMICPYLVSSATVLVLVSIGLILLPRFFRL